MLATVVLGVALSGGAARPEQVDLAPAENSARSPHAVPEWALGAVWYQVFPERFANGNPGNDPAAPGIFRPDWTSDYYSVTTLELESARAAAVAWGRGQRFARSRTALGAVATHRRYGGDLQGVVERLDHLRSLGVTAIYLSPVFQARSEHKYETSDHRHIDESLGGPGPARPIWRPDPLETDDPATWGWTEADRYLIDVLLPEARRRGMRVILDGVWNHVGVEHWAFQDVLRNGRSSRYASWFRVRFDEVGRVMSWVGWDRTNGDLPEFAQTSRGDLVPPVKEHIFAVTRRWMDPDGDGDPSDGIDGWRLDVAPDIGIDFWRDWHDMVKSINPEAVTIGEIWEPAGRWIREGCFDAQMNYPFAFAIIDWLRGNECSERLGERLRRLVGEQDEHDLAHMNLLAGHDTERLASMLENPGREYDPGRGVVRGPAGYNAGRASARTYDLVVLAYAMLTGLPGSPMVFQGDEWGMTGGDDPECRKPVPWPDLGPYESPDDAPDLSMRERLADWLRLRGDPVVGPALRFGELSLPDSGDPDVVVIRRELASGDSGGIAASVVLVIANRGEGVFDAGTVLGLEGVRGAGPMIVQPRRAGIWSFP